MQTSKVGTLTRTSAHGNTGTRGFTFIELMVVLTILGVCAAIVFPKLDGLLVRESEPWKSGRRFVRIAKHAHEFAVATESMFLLHVDVAAGRYWVSSQGSDSGPDSAAAYPSLKGQLGDGVAISHVELAEDTTTLEDILSIRFSPDGWSDSVMMTLTLPDGVSVTAVIGEWFGDVELVSEDSAG